MKIIEKPVNKINVGDFITLTGEHKDFDLVTRIIQGASYFSISTGTKDDERAKVIYFNQTVKCQINENGLSH
jgi:hypothetical protein